MADIPQPPALYREADGNVVLSSNNMTWRHFHKYGAVPLQIYQHGAPPLMNEFPGSGASVAWREDKGNDPTEATPNGPDGNPIHIQSDPSTAGNNYFGREVTVDTANKVYVVKMFCPDFVASLEPHDDSIPPAPGFGESGWYTPYHPGKFASWINSATRPVVFSGQPGNTDGYMFVASERDEASPWAQKLREYRDGRIAFKINLSLHNSGSGAFAGFLFRTTVPPNAQNKHDVYNAPGIRLHFNKQGRVEAIRVNEGGSRDLLWAGQLSPVETNRLLGSRGIVVQVRTHNSLPGVFWLLIDGQQLGVVSDEHLLAGPHFALYANSSGGYVTFQQRAIYDVGVELTARFEAHPDWIVTDYTLALAPGVSRPRQFERVNMPGMFLNLETFPLASRSVMKVFDDAVMDVENGSHLMNDTLGMWAGKSSGTLGLLAIPEIVTIDGRPAPGFHIHVDRNTWVSKEFVMMLDAMTEGVDTEASEVRVRTRWASRIP